MGPSCAVAFGTFKNLKGMPHGTAFCSGIRRPRSGRYVSFLEEVGLGWTPLSPCQPSPLPQPWGSKSPKPQATELVPDSGKKNRPPSTQGGRGSCRQPQPPPSACELQLGSLPTGAEKAVTPVPCPGCQGRNRRGRQGKGYAFVTRRMALTWISPQAASPVGASFAGTGFTFAPGLGSRFVALDLVSPLPEPLPWILRARLSSLGGAFVTNKNI